MEYSDQILYISDLATGEGVNFVIEDATFKECVLRGPAIVKLSQTSASGGGITIPGHDPSTVIVVAEEGRTVLPVGVVVIRNCRFDGCTFEAISFFAQASEAEALEKSFMSNVPSAG